MSEVEIMQRIIEGIERRDNSQAFIELLKSNKDNTTRLLGVYINKMALVGLHILNVEKYTGNDATVIETIEVFSKGEAIK